MFVTVATVGYGDITPNTVLGRFAAMGMIGIAIITVPDMTNDLLAKMASQSVYARARYNAKSGRSQHVLICGDVKSSSIIEFFKELFHEDHEMENLHAVVLQPGLPTHEMQMILKDPAFQLSVTYLEGSPLNDKDLNRANAEKARAVFLLTNKFSAHPDNEDAKIILQQFSIQRYLRLYSPNQLKRTLFCMQLIRPENKRHLVTAGSSGHNRDGNNDNQENMNLVVCLNEIKMGVIAKAVIFPGTNTLIMNLLSSFADDTNTGASNATKHIEGIETLEEDEDSSDWIGEYQRGCDWEIYTTALSPSFEGATFCTLSEILYSKLGIVLFGLEVEDLRKDKSPPRILLNPADFVIPSNEEARITAFVIAKNKAQSDLSFSYDNDDMHLSHLSMLSGALAANATAPSMLGGGGPHRLSIAHRPALFGALGPAGFQAKNLGSNAAEEEAKLAAAMAAKKEKLAWQALLRRHESEKSAETMQEELQKADDQHLRENYYVRDYLMDLRDATVRTSVTDAKPFIENHIIIIGKALSNLYDLIRPLRAKTLGTLKHIVILYPDELPLAVWQRISIFESVWIVRGSPLEESDIRRCGIFKCKQVVMLADASMVSANAAMDRTHNVADMDALVDADAIFCYQAVKRLNEAANVVVEIVRQSNVSYLDPETGLNSNDIDYKFTPQFASGALFTTSLLDTLACQAFYNTKIVEVINRFVGFGVEIKEKAGDKHGSSSSSLAGGPPSPAGRIGSSANKASMYSENGAGTGSNGEPNNRTPFNPKTLIGSALYQIPVLVEGLESRTYGALYSHLAKRKQIPLGILRGVFSNTKSGPKANKMPYVFTNPPKDTELFSCDKVFVLSQNPVKLRGAKEETKENATITSQMRQRQKTADDIVHILNDLTEQLRRQKEDQDAQLAAQVAMLQEQMHTQMQNMMSLVEQTTVLASQAAHASHYIAHHVNLANVVSQQQGGGGFGNGGGAGGGGTTAGNRPATVSFAHDGRSPGGGSSTPTSRRPSMHSKIGANGSTNDPGYYTLSSPSYEFAPPPTTPVVGRPSIMRTSTIPTTPGTGPRPVSAGASLYSSPTPTAVNRSSTPTVLQRSGGGNGSGAGLAPYKSPSTSRRNSTTLSPMVGPVVSAPGLAVTPSGGVGGGGAGGARSLNSTPINGTSTNQANASSSANRKRGYSSHY